MSAETESDFYQSEDDLDEDEATQYIIEQSLIQYRKLKGLNPRLKLVKHASKHVFLHRMYLFHCVNSYFRNFLVI